MSEILVAKNINKIYDEGNIRTQVLTGLGNLVNAGERIAIVGTSGSGKNYLIASIRRSSVHLNKFGCDGVTI